MSHAYGVGGELLWHLDQVWHSRSGDTFTRFVFSSHRSKSDNQDGIVTRKWCVTFMQVGNRWCAHFRPNGNEVVCLFQAGR